MNERIDRLRLKEIRASIEQGLSRELSGTSRTGSCTDQAINDRCKNDRVSVGRDLHDILTGEAPRPLHPLGQDLIDDLAVFIGCTTQRSPAIDPFGVHTAHRLGNRQGFRDR